MAIGIPTEQVRRDYHPGCSPDEVHSDLEMSGFMSLAPAGIEPGDVLVVRTGPAQLHFVLLTPDGYIHADARLRRVVEVPGDVPWPVVSAWRLPGEAEPPAIRPPALS